jgi:hypothetical protein
LFNLPHPVMPEKAGIHAFLASKFVTAQVAKGGKTFFFEKKNQKTFLLRFARCLKRPRPKTNKVFLLLFVHKKKFFLA